MTYLLDTNAVVVLLRGRSPSLMARRASTDPSALHTCTVVKAELFYGSARSVKPAESRATQEAFLRGLVSHDFDDAAAPHYARVRAALDAAGTPIGTMDLLIASIALANNLILITHNTREFSRVPGLQLEDWETP